MKYALAALILIAIPVITFLAALHCYDTGYVYGSLVVAFIGGLAEFFTLAQLTLVFLEEAEDAADEA
jgi:hypothetical protein